VEDQTKINPYILFAASVTTTFISIAFRVEWLAFFSLAPLFAISDIPVRETAWRRLGLIALALAIIFWSERYFYSHAVPYSLGAAITIAFCFWIQNFARKALGNRTGKILIVFLWLAIEYVVLKMRIAENFVFVADLGMNDPEWTSWTVSTGYLGGSFWLLFTNLNFYHAFLKGRFSVVFLFVFLVIVIAPLIISMLSSDYTTLTKGDMIWLYENNDVLAKDGRLAMYLSVGEWIPRTAAWVSALVLLYVAVKSKTTKK
jgi:hypothetical protein